MVEAMIVIVVVGLIAAMAAPPFFRYVASNRLQANTDRLTADLQYARSLAISNAQVLRFTSTAGGYRITNPITNDIIRESNLTNGLALGGAATADFYPWGMADPLVMKIGNSAGSKQITILPTGIVEVH